MLSRRLSGPCSFDRPSTAERRPITHSLISLLRVAQVRRLMIADSAH
jgi:hypothetical protein